MLHPVLNFKPNINPKSNPNSKPCPCSQVTEVECALKAIEFWHSAAHAAYGSSSLMEALRLYQKAAQIAEVLSENLGESMRLQR